MPDQESDPQEAPNVEPLPEPPVGFLRRTVAPALAIVILYASIRVLPAVLVSQPPPIDFGDLIKVFLVSLVVFSLFGLYTDYRTNRQEAEK